MWPKWQTIFDLGHETEYLRALSYFITTIMNFKDWNGCAPLEFIMNYVLFLVLTTNTIKFMFNQRITELWPICRHRPNCVTLPYPYLMAFILCFGFMQWQCSILFWFQKGVFSFCVIYYAWSIQCSLPRWRDRTFYIENKHNLIHYFNDTSCFTLFPAIISHRYFCVIVSS